MFEKLLESLLSHLRELDIILLAGKTFGELAMSQNNICALYEPGTVAKTLESLP